MERSFRSCCHAQFTWSLTFLILRQKKTCYLSLVKLTLKLNLSLRHSGIVVKRTDWPLFRRNWLSQACSDWPSLYYTRITMTTRRRALWTVLICESCHWCLKMVLVVLKDIMPHHNDWITNSKVAVNEAKWALLIVIVREKLWNLLVCWRQAHCLFMVAFWYQCQHSRTHPCEVLKRFQESYFVSALLDSMLIVCSHQCMYCIIASH